MTTIQNSSIVGGLMWSIRGHRRDGGWYYHNEGGTPVNSFHVPGFSVGFEYEEQRLLDLLKANAFLMAGKAISSEKVPAPAPVLMVQGEGLTWRGATGAASYTIERSESPKGPWKVLAVGIEDAVIADVKTFEPSDRAANPLELFYDETKVPGKTYYYRVKGENKAGASSYSNVLKVN